MQEIKIKPVLWRSERSIGFGILLSKEVTVRKNTTLQNTLLSSLTAGLKQRNVRYPQM